MNLMIETLNRVKKNNKKNEAFIKRNFKRWKTPFLLLDSLHFICLDLGADINNSFRSSNDNDILFDVLLRLHAHACHIASEIICLMKNGFANGAYSEWRSLYETYITALFIREHGKECAQRFIDHSIVDHFNLMKLCITNKTKINQVPPSEAEYEHCEIIYKEICSKYENNFQRPYGWAKIFINENVRMNFKEIEERVGQAHNRFYYSKVSTANHCNYYGLINKLGLSETTQNVLLVGQSNADMLEPGNAVAVTLTQITGILLMHVDYPETEKIMLMKTLYDLQQEITDKFMKVHNCSKAD